MAPSSLLAIATFALLPCAVLAQYSPASSGSTSKAELAVFVLFALILVGVFGICLVRSYCFPDDGAASPSRGRIDPAGSASPSSANPLQRAKRISGTTLASEAPASSTTIEMADHGATREGAVAAVNPLWDSATGSGGSQDLAAVAASARAKSARFSLSAVTPAAPSTVGNNTSVKNPLHSSIKEGEDETTEVDEEGVGNDEDDEAAAATKSKSKHASKSSIAVNSAYIANLSLSEGAGVAGGETMPTASNNVVRSLTNRNASFAAAAAVHDSTSLRQHEHQHQHQHQHEREPDHDTDKEDAFEMEERGEKETKLVASTAAAPAPPPPPPAVPVVERSKEDTEEELLRSISAAAEEAGSVSFPSTYAPHVNAEEGAAPVMVAAPAPPPPPPPPPPRLPSFATATTSGSVLPTGPPGPPSRPSLNPSGSSQLSALAATLSLTGVADLANGNGGAASRRSSTAVASSFVASDVGTSSNVRRVSAAYGGAVLPAAAGGGYALSSASVAAPAPVVPLALPSAVAMAAVGSRQ